MMSSRTFTATALALALSTPLLLAQQSAGTAQHLDARGKHVMGFDQQKTAHHFRLYEDGGAIEVSVKDTADAENLKAIRAHLPHIATMFADGQFDAPMLVHDTTNVPGAADLARLKSRLHYNFVETPAGGRVDIVTTDKEALAAVHAFLRFQITDHQTGDPVTAAKRGR
jgi:hypothetical protein